MFPRQQVINRVRVELVGSVTMVPAGRMIPAVAFGKSVPGFPYVGNPAAPLEYLPATPS